MNYNSISDKKIDRAIEGFKNGENDQDIANALDIPKSWVTALRGKWNCILDHYRDLYGGVYDNR